MAPLCIFVCVCVRERARARERERARARAYVCVTERESARARVCVEIYLHMSYVYHPRTEDAILSVSPYICKYNVSNASLMKLKKNVCVVFTLLPSRPKRPNLHTCRIIR
jgi:hypothetical protein